MTVAELIEALERFPAFYEVECDGQDGAIAELRLRGWPEQEPVVLIVAGAAP